MKTCDQFCTDEFMAVVSRGRAGHLLWLTDRNQQEQLKTVSEMLLLFPDKLQEVTYWRAIALVA